MVDLLNIQNRTIFCRDNLEILEGINSNSIDLIYLDPPFNKNKVFTAPIGSSAEGASFSDIFREEDIKDEWLQTIKEDNYNVFNFLQGVKNIEGNSYNFCYLAYMAIRLMECHRILKNTGSLYLHCDPTMSHYLKLLLDYVFGEKQFRNEIIWHYYNIANTAKKHFGRKHDIILFYTKSNSTTFNWDEMREAYAENSNWVKNSKSYGDTRYTANEQGKLMHDVWRIPTINNMSKERTGYPTQKPLILLERIITASSNEGDVVLDPFCGCATTCVAAEKLNRKWVGIDVSVKAYELVKIRMEKEVVSDLFEIKDLIFSTEPPKRKNDGDKAIVKKYVYIISNKQYPNKYKVGIASNIKNRLGAYQTADPERNYKLEYEVETAQYRELEKHIHHKFENQFEWVWTKNITDIITEMEIFLANGKN